MQWNLNERPPVVYLTKISIGSSVNQIALVKLPVSDHLL